VLAAAAAAIRREGAGVPIATIAADAGVGVGTLYRRYPSREALLPSEERDETVTSRLATDAEVKTWQEDGWVLLEGLVGTDEIDAASEDLQLLFPSPEEYHADPEGVTERWKGRPAKPKEDYVWPDEGPGFRADQQRWMGAFPFAGSGALNRLYVHDSIVNFAERALETADIRLYQAHASAKFSG
jgi:AcrR family transcriptional regulator